MTKPRGKPRRKRGGRRRPTPYFYLAWQWIEEGHGGWENRELWVFGALCILSALQLDKTGASIHSVAALALLAGVHRTTAGKALDDLVERGVITRAPGDAKRFHFDRDLGRDARSWVRVSWPRSVRRLRMASRRIWIQVLRFKSTAGLWPAQAKIGLWAGRSVRQVRRHLGYLVRMGALWRIRMGGQGRRRPTDYYRNLLETTDIDREQQVKALRRDVWTHGDEEELRAFDATMERARKLYDSM